MKLKPQFDHVLRTSFYLYFDHNLLVKGETFSTTSGNLYLTPDSKHASKDVWASPFRQWIGDSSISGLTVTSGVNVGPSFFGPSPNLAIDYDGGRIITTAGYLSGQPSANMNLKEVNVYISDEPEEDIISDTKMLLIPKYSNQAPVTGLSPDVRTYPACYINFMNGVNTPYEFGGVSNTKPVMRVIVLADSAYMLDGLLGICRDMYAKSFPIFDANLLPYNSLGDLKSGVYSFSQMARDVFNTSPEKIAFISKVATSRVSSAANQAINKNVRIGVADFFLEIIRGV